MKLSEYYEKYWRVKNAAGELVPPHPLTDTQREFLDNATQNPDCIGITMVGSRTRRPINIDVQYLNEQLKKLPDYLQPQTP